MRPAGCRLLFFRGCAGDMLPLPLQYRVGLYRLQKMVELPSYKRGCHVITRKVLEQLPELGEFDVGLVNFFSAPSHAQKLLDWVQRTL